MFLTHFALSTAVFLGILQNETQHLHNPFYVEELKVVTEKLILNSKTEKVYEVKDEGLVSYDTLHRKKRELEMTYEPVCATKVSKVAPKFGEGYYGENKTVLNGNTLNEELNKFIQSVDFVFGSVKEPKESVCLSVRPAQTCLKVSIFILEQSGSV